MAGHDTVVEKDHYDSNDSKQNCSLANESPRWYGNIDEDKLAAAKKQLGIADHHEVIIRMSPFLDLGLDPQAPGITAWGDTTTQMKPNGPQWGPEAQARFIVTVQAPVSVKWANIVLAHELTHVALDSKHILSCKNREEWNAFIKEDQEPAAHKASEELFDSLGIAVEGLVPEPKELDMDTMMNHFASQMMQEQDDGKRFHYSDQGIGGIEDELVKSGIAERVPNDQAWGCYGTYRP